MMTNNGIPITFARFNGKCSHCGARIRAGNTIVKSAEGWIHARCPKDVPLATEQAALDTRSPGEEDGSDMEMNPLFIDGEPDDYAETSTEPVTIRRGVPHHGVTIPRP
jgi:hypothetical protein